MKRFFYCTLFRLLIFSSIHAFEFTVSSYNCGGLSDHYDYLRAATMQKIMQERYDKEPLKMAQLERIQQIALKKLFSKDEERAKAEQLWNQTIKKQFNQLMKDPKNREWFEKSEKAITSYRIRPINLYDSDIVSILKEHLQRMTQGDNQQIPEMLTEGREVMTEHIFRHHLKYDIICLQEATYLKESLFPFQYKVSFANADHSINGIAWNQERFELIEEIGNILNRAYAVKLMDKESGKTVLIASGHITGCHPFMEVDQVGGQGKDSDKGDNELETILDLFETIPADVKMIGMDANVAATHPRMKILVDYGYQLDAENFIEQTCTNPNMLVNTRIDWIAVKAQEASITNIPVLGVGLNSIYTNISDHKPIAAQVSTP